MLTAESKTSKGSFRGLEVLPPLFFVTPSSRIVAFRNMTPKNSTRPEKAPFIWPWLEIKVQRPENAIFFWPSMSDTGSKRINALRKSRKEMAYDD